MHEAAARLAAARSDLRDPGPGRGDDGGDGAGPGLDPLAPLPEQRTVDSRFMERRRAATGAGTRQQLVRLLVLVVVAAIGVGVVTVFWSPVLDVDRIEVVGARHLDPESVSELVGIEVGEPLVLADVGAAADRVRTLPWVASAEVRREFPDAVVVDVVERIPVATLENGGRLVLVDAAGIVIDRATAMDAIELVEVASEDLDLVAGDQIPAELFDALQLAAELRSTSVNAATVFTTPSLRAELIGGGAIHFADVSDLPDKLQAVATMQARVDWSCLAVLDVAVPTHPVLTRLPGCS